jgi:hypothetical protein
MVKFKELPRPAGSGLIHDSAKPLRRGVWDLYVTTNPRIGIFEASYWLELAEGVECNYDTALAELAEFIRDNIEANIVVIEHNHHIIMGGYGSGEAAGRNFLKPQPARKKNQQRDTMIDGFEIRLMHDDAVTFLALWQGYGKQ